MEYYKPAVKLKKTIHMDQPDEYFLHAVTTCDQTVYVTAGHAPIPDQLENGVLEINLKIAADMELPDFCLPTPVVHTIRIGALPSDEESVDIKVNIVEVARGEGEPKGSTTVSSASADEEDKPVGNPA